MSIKSFFTSEPFKAAQLVIGSCIVFNGLSVSYTFIMDVYDTYADIELYSIVEMIDNTRDINRKLEYMDIVRNTCLTNTKWKDLDKDSATYFICDWAMGTEL